VTLPKPSGHPYKSPWPSLDALACDLTPYGTDRCAEPGCFLMREQHGTFQQLVRHGYVVLPSVRTVAIPREIGDGVISDDWGDF